MQNFSTDTRQVGPKAAALSLHAQQGFAATGMSRVHNDQKRPTHGQDQKAICSRMFETEEVLMARLFLLMTASRVRPYAWQTGLRVGTLQVSAGGDR